MLLLPMPQLPFPCITWSYLCHLINLGLVTYGIKNILHQSQFISLHSSAKTQGWIVTMERVRGEQCSTLGRITELYNGHGVFWNWYSRLILSSSSCKIRWDMTEKPSKNVCTLGVFSSKASYWNYRSLFPEAKFHCKTLRNHFKNTNKRERH